MVLNKVISILKNSNQIAILPHISADGDALGSSFALAQALKILGKDVDVILEEKVPELYAFLPGKEFLKENSDNTKKYEVALALDTGELERLGERASVFNNSDVKINIDHHKTNTEFGDYNYVELNSSATGEIIYQLIKRMGVDLNPEISLCLYVAISADTGRFRYSNTTGITHHISADLINNGVDVGWVSQQLYENDSIKRITLMGMAIETIELIEDGKIAFTHITQDMLEKSGASKGDTEGISNLARSISGVEVSVLFKEEETGGIKVSMRSKSYLDVSKIAEQFNGGGHTRAAGCFINENLEQVKDKILHAIKGDI